MEIVTSQYNEILTKEKLSKKAFAKKYIDELIGEDLSLHIICADDDHRNIEALKIAMKKNGVLNCCDFFKNGGEVVEFCQQKLLRYKKPN